MARQAAEDRREEILRAAREVFREHGFEAAKVSAIADRAGIAKGTVYLYFSSKQAILEALCGYYRSMMAEVITPALANPDSRQALKNAVHAALELAKRERDLVKLLDLQIGLSKKPAAAANPAAQKAMVKFFRDCQAKGEARSYDPQVTMELVGGFVQWITRLCLVWGDIDLSRYEDTAISMLSFALFIDRGAGK